METLARPRKLWQREMPEAFLSRAPLCLHGAHPLPPSPRGNHVCFPPSGTQGGPAGSPDVHQPRGTSPPSAPRASEPRLLGPSPRWKGWESWPGRKGQGCPLSFLLHFSGETVLQEADVSTSGPSLPLLCSLGISVAILAVK